ncbi:MAG: helix-turn-helix transcriptional regulator [Spirochaetales bacterium]|nr:helix-turn-helix transcriptional regulator [Spirochaetales bacterium]
MTVHKDCYHKEYIRRIEGTENFNTIHPHFQDFHRMSVEKDFEYPIHRHTDYEVIWVEKGPYLCCLNDIELLLENNEFLIIKPGDMHQDHLKKGQSHYVLHFSLKDELFTQSLTPCLQKGLYKLKEGELFFQDMIEESRLSPDKLRFSSSLQDALLEAFFWRIVRQLPESSLSRTFGLHNFQQQFKEALYRVFSDYFDTPLSVDSIALHMGMSRRSLSLKCQKFLNNSPGRLFLEYRIKRAENLLVNGGLSVKEVSHELGFENPFNFTRAFRRITGKCPSDYF